MSPAGPRRPGEAPLTEQQVVDDLLGAAASAGTPPSDQEVVDDLLGEAAVPAAAPADDEVAEAEVVEDAAAEATVAAEVVEEDLAEALGSARRERDDYLDALRRMQADFENYRKRVQRQQDEAAARAAERLVGELLPALDAFDLAEAHLAGDESVSPGGLLQAAALLRDVLAKAGLERVAQAGDPFDPTAHDAVEMVEGDGGEGGQVVDAVLRAGYRFGGRVIRPAMVKVRG